MLQTSRLRVRFKMRPSDFQFFQLHYAPEIDSASNRNEYQESSWGVKSSRRVRLTTSPPSVSRLYKMWEPRRLTTLWPSTACCRDSFYFVPKETLQIFDNTLQETEPKKDQLKRWWRKLRDKSSILCSLGLLVYTEAFYKLDTTHAEYTLPFFYPAAVRRSCPWTSSPTEHEDKQCKNCGRYEILLHLFINYFPCLDARITAFISCKKVTLSLCLIN
jgi:hypothetical protein